MIVLQSLVAAGMGVTTIPGLALRAHRIKGIRATKLIGADRHVYAATYGQPPDPPATAALLSALARSMNPPDHLTVLGPVPSPVPRLRGRYRWQILVKSLKRETGLAAVRVTVNDMERGYQRRAIKFDVDVDPIEMW
jgi:hypothetical protein